MAPYSLCSLLCFFLFFITFAEGSLVPAVYMFGDSLIDVGNNNHITFSVAKANHRHYGIDFPGGNATGRFSNGKNAADFLAEKVGLPAMPPYLSLLKASNKSNAFLAGVSFASGGAGILDDTDKKMFPIKLSKQVEYFSTVYGDLVQELGTVGVERHLSKSIFGIVIGSNDIINNFRTIKLHKKIDPQTLVDTMIKGMREELKRIYNLGARKFLVVGAASVGCTPAHRLQSKTSGCNEEANYWALKYNEGVQSVLQVMKSENQDMNYVYFDLYGGLLNLIQNPAQYGFNEVQSACCGMGRLRARIPCFSFTKYCNNRTDHVFFDLYHPTEAASRICADLFFDGPTQYAHPINVSGIDYIEEFPRMGDTYIIRMIKHPLYYKR